MLSGIFLHGLLLPAPLTISEAIKEVLEATWKVQETIASFTLLHAFGLSPLLFYLGFLVSIQLTYLCISQLFIFLVSLQTS
ncbi:hypothetical protein GLYMA_18G233300v4 [Glycine max]|uniref:Uncharacterized protein n=1 Tax=Glycine max TaxID=3847 RepID=K7MUA6_SOYBN|nr:hypothetical protein GYH30_050883 [Glycine max]KRH00762.1 hypothetical protein GLYMA_18G233300v4 [Glycine max]